MSEIIRMNMHPTTLFTEAEARYLMTNKMINTLARKTLQEVNQAGAIYLDPTRKADIRGAFDSAYERQVDVVHRALWEAYRLGKEAAKEGA